MAHRTLPLIGASLLAAALFAGPVSHLVRPALAGEEPHLVPAPASAPADASSAGLQRLTVSGGCFWGVQGVFEHVRGVRKAVAGYTGGAADTAQYETVSGGDTGHAESVQITFDPREVSAGRLMQIFFSVALDPTRVDAQGPDSGTQYRSEIWFADPAQERLARAYIAQLDAAHAFAAPIATRVDPLRGFWPAESYHQDYLALHPDAPYIAINDQPKVAALRQLFPADYVASPATVMASAD